ncbi:MAG: serine hydrolase domain-containing protein [Rhodospirillaceae bacterium]
MSHAIARIVLIASLALASPLAAQEGVAKNLLAPKAIEAWADDVFGKALKEHRFSGLGITVTEGDKVLFTKGYGYQDWAAKSPVSPDRTQFRIASLTKTFVATGIVQLLERGQIKSLDDPANKYLKRFQFKPNGGQEVTVWDLLTHRAGFGTPPQVQVDNDTLKLPVAASLLAAYVPDYARPRDTVSVYCNYCWGMLGVMIEDLTGKTLPDYLRDHIFTPLGMNNTELSVARTQPAGTITQYAFVPDGPALATAYPLTTVMTPGAGAVISTPADMAKWLIANVTEGSGAGNKVLTRKSWQLMHTRHRGNHPAASGFGAAFFIYDYNGEKVLEHYGSLQHRSMEFMLMDSKVGIFVTMAGGGQPGARADVRGAVPAAVTGRVAPQVSHSGVRALILDHFLGALPFTKDPKTDVSKYVGRYRDIPRTPGATQEPDEITVAASGDGGLIIGGRGVYRASGNDVFTLDRPLDLEAGFMEANRYVFGTDAAGKVAALYQHVNAGGYQRVGN